MGSYKLTNEPVFEGQVDDLAFSVYRSNSVMGAAAAQDAATSLIQTLQQQAIANIILASANSQLTFLAALRQTRGINWSRVNIFHMDEYLNIETKHPASFSHFLQRHFVEFIHPAAFFLIPAWVKNVERACQEYHALLSQYPADLCIVGFGENGHLAFNDPPFADFNDPAWVKVVRLDERSRQQQVGEGHFTSLEDVPKHAITLTIPALLSAKKILAVVPEARKAQAVTQALLGPIQESCPASVLRRAPHAHLYLDLDSAAGVLSHEW